MVASVFWVVAYWLHKDLTMLVFFKWLLGGRLLSQVKKSPPSNVDDILVSRMLRLCLQVFFSSHSIHQAKIVS